MRACGPALRADLQRYFGLDLDRVERGEVSVAQAAACAAYLPMDGAVAYEMNGKAPVWGDGLCIQADMANSLRWLVWAKTKDGERNRRKPVPLAPPKGKATGGNPAVALPADEVAKYLARPRKA